MCASHQQPEGTNEQNPSDADLMKALKNGDMEALKMIYIRYSYMVKAAVYRISPSVIPADVEELTHDIFIALIKSAPQFDNTKNLKPWLYGIAVHKAEDNKRKGWVHTNLLKKHNKEVEALRPSYVESVSRQLEVKQELEEAFKDLPKDQHDVMVLHAIEGFKGSEIADILGIEVNTVWTRLHRARKTLMEKIKSGRDSAGV